MHWQKTFFFALGLAAVAGGAALCYAAKIEPEHLHVTRPCLAKPSPSNGEAHCPREKQHK